ncbi:MAG: hypothetical protein EA368_00565 [Leptolyngbya sp. DLM2.Bin27]|nr:MAG: hypothetical protein EA368_00565 [Leptolyngbya sp. DLM2.Bin27]
MQSLNRVLNRVCRPEYWRQLAIVFLAGLVVLVTTACGATQASTPANNSPTAVNSSPTEGMYPYKDTDMDTRAADAKADRLIREADQRIKQGYDQSVGESAKQAAENIGQSTQRAAENAAENAQQGLDQLGQKAKGVVNGAADQIAPNQPNG